MTHLFAFPLLSLFIFVMWLLLNQSLGAGHVLLGALLGLSGSWLAAALLPAKARVRRPGVMLRLSVLVLVDIVRSNIAVARIILRPGQRDQTSGFLDIPLEQRQPVAALGVRHSSLLVLGAPGAGSTTALASLAAAAGDAARWLPEDPVGMWAALEAPGLLQPGRLLLADDLDLVLANATSARPSAKEPVQPPASASQRPNGR